MGLAKFWVTFSQTHLVTLAEKEKYIKAFAQKYIRKYIATLFWE
jgi:hypothetical protein